MNDLLVMLGHVMPVEMIIEHLEKDLIKYKEDPTDENSSKLEMSMMLFMSKRAVKNAGSIDNLMSEFDLMRQGKDLLSPKEG